MAASAAMLSCAYSASAQNKSPEYEFSTVKENWISPVKNQYRSGTCWCFSGIGFLESEIKRIKGYDNVDLSEMWVVGHSYFDRGVKYVRLDGKLNFAAGSDFGDVLKVIENYGIVSQEAYPGMQYGTELPEQAEFDAVLAGFIDAAAKNPNRTLSTAWQKAYKGIIAAYQGEWLETFTVDGASHTPQSYRDYLGIVPENYVSLTSFTHQPWYKPFVIEVQDNWRWDESYNLPLDELMEVMYNAIDKGYTIAWGSDVSEKGFTRDGLAVMPADKPKTAAGSDQERWVGKSQETAEEESAELPEEVEVTQELRQEGYDRKLTTDDHGMQIYGIAKDQNGTKYFMVKNSWGDAGKYKGLWYASDTFVRYKTLNIVVHKDAIPKDIRKKLGL
ncbi:MAG: aminopeptidase [Bacteroidales bacterium]|nr:aminopeptidase [Bacteroidales bacterium]